MLKLSYSLYCILALTISIATIDAYGLEASLWTPDEVLLKEKYAGMITLEEEYDEEIVFTIVTNNEEVIELITEKITVPNGTRHGVFEFKTVGGGDADIYAIAKDLLLEDNVQVKESASIPVELDLIMPANFINVLVDDSVKYGYVFLINDFENTIPSDKSIPITLTSNGEVTIPDPTISIQPGEHYTKFSFIAKGDGTITVSAPDLLPDEEEVTLESTSDIELQIEAAPDPIPTASSVQIYFWLERDGKPYLAPHDVKVTISIDKSFNLSFDSAVKGAIILTPDAATTERRTEDSENTAIITRTEVSLSRDATKEYIIKEGEYYGKITAYSTFDPAGGITLNGLAESINPQNDEEIIKVSSTAAISTASSNDDEIATSTNVLALPDPAYDIVEIIVSSQSGSGPTIESDDEPFVVFVDNVLRLDSTNEYVIPTDENYAIVNASVIDFDETEIIAERNEAERADATIDTAGKYVREPDIDIVPLPILFDTEQDLFLVASSHDKIKTNADSTEEGTIVSITSRPSFDFETIRIDESTIVVRGTISSILEDDPEIFVTSNAETATETLELYNIDRKELEVTHPDEVQPDELFPLFTHITDLEGNLIKKSELSVSTDIELLIDGDFAQINEAGSHTMIFYEKNSVPIESEINVEGVSRAQVQAQAQAAVKKLTEEEIRDRLIPRYELNVEDVEGSGTFKEGENVTLSAIETKEDFFLYKKTFDGWENLPYNENEITFEIDDDVDTKPRYRDDFSGLFLVVGSAGAIGSLTFMKMKKDKKSKKDDGEDDFAGMFE